MGIDSVELSPGDEPGCHPGLATVRGIVSTPHRWRDVVRTASQPPSWTSKLDDVSRETGDFGAFEFVRKP